MFLQVCVKNCVRHPLTGRNNPPTPGRHSPRRQTHPRQADTPWQANTPPPADSYCYGMHPTGIHSCLTLNAFLR